MTHPTPSEFARLAKRWSVVPVWQEITADFETPVSAFTKLALDRPESSHACLLESVEGGERVARYSFLAASPTSVFECRGSHVQIREGGELVRSQKAADPLKALERWSAAWKGPDLPGLPRFYGGAVGYLGYSVAGMIEPRLAPKPARHPAPKPARHPARTRADDDLGAPDIVMMRADRVVIFDHLAHKILVVRSVRPGPRPLETYRRAVQEIETTVRRLAAPLPWTPRHAGRRLPLRRWRSNLEPGRFQKMVKRVKRYIEAGDIIQAVVSQRFRAPSRTHPFQVYRALRVLNPSPYMYYLRAGAQTLVGSSPEILVRKERDHVQLRPIAGTRRRGRNEGEDRALAASLQKDPKERAEHLMLVDLGRNDLGRVCRYGTVRVPQFMSVERYSHVMHLVSDIIGRARKGVNAFDVLRAAFPAGTVTGSPKVRAMEIIAEQEPVRRGPYAGAVGYVSFQGNMDMAITIRTLLVQGSEVFVQAGAGIVADSRPDREHRETVNKAAALFESVRLAEQGSL